MLRQNLPSSFDFDPFSDGAMVLSSTKFSRLVSLSDPPESNLNAARVLVMEK